MTLAASLAGPPPPLRDVKPTNTLGTHSLVPKACSNTFSPPRRCIYSGLYHGDLGRRRCIYLLFVLLSDIDLEEAVRSLFEGLPQLSKLPAPLSLLVVVHQEPP